MIKTTILKVKHSGVDEAEKLLPYIQQADVFGMEFATQTETESREHERIWEEVLDRGSRNQARNLIMEDKESSRDRRVKEYNDATLDYLFRNKVLLWSVERFYEEEARKIRDMKEYSDITLKASFTHLMDREEKRFLNSLWACLNYRLNILNLRDAEIARNIDCAEEDIQDYLKNKILFL